MTTLVPYGQVPTIDVQGRPLTPASPCRFDNYCGRGEANLWVATAGAWVSAAAKYAGQSREKIDQVHRLVNRYMDLLKADRFVLLDHTSVVQAAIAVAELAGELGKTWAAELGQTFEPPKTIGVHPPVANTPIHPEIRAELDQMGKQFGAWVEQWVEAAKEKVKETMMVSWPLIAIGVLLVAAMAGGRR